MLRCNCGGAVELTSQSYGDESAFEQYECVSCGRTGTLTMDSTGDSYTGCLTNA